MSWKDIIKESIEEEILEEVEDEGGALGLKNLKDIADKKTLKETLSSMEDEGKIFEHEDGDFYTHEPKREEDEVGKAKRKLVGNQVKIARVAPPKDEITGADFEELREQKKLLKWEEILKKKRKKSRGRTRKKGKARKKRKKPKSKKDMKVNRVYPSDRKGKKIMMLTEDGRKIHAGAKGYGNYKGKGKNRGGGTHKNKKRRANFKARHNCHECKGPIKTPKCLACKKLW